MNATLLASGTKRPRREGLPRQQRHYFRLRIGKLALPRLIWQIHSAHDWQLISSSYCRAEVARNVVKFGDAAVDSWTPFSAQIDWVPNALTSKRPLLLTASKDKPVLISALAARCDALLTLDVGDFQLLLGAEVYGMLVTTPRDFLRRQDLG